MLSWIILFSFFFCHKFQYRFLIDGVCRYDEMLPYVADDYGMINNLLVTLEENTMPLTLQDDPQMVRSTDVRTALYAVCSVFHLTFFLSRFSF